MSVVQVEPSFPLGGQAIELVEQDRGPAWTARLAGDGRDAVRQGQDSGDVVDVGRSDDAPERVPLSPADQLVFTARLPMADRRRAGGFTLPSFARMWINGHFVEPCPDPVVDQ
ncbi:hypothetical protein F9278_37040 [Streptomyces phaeolivaceus]|uniref:Uncharacterized protein n=1 Tax=Streptomyces phaeolivaceus TaxID=2653200 RepID=A0A5P8KC08_9ACTN|nr:hypothetical protein [Streptomyces phaeolivaceus]QFR00874.1 hypothetical protein F9278_37040 [Streptomyces phaeolivaceus]